MKKFVRRFFQYRNIFDKKIRPDIFCVIVLLNVFSLAFCGELLSSQFDKAVSGGYYVRKSKQVIKQFDTVYNQEQNEPLKNAYGIEKKIFKKQTSKREFNIC